jgi:hypothetical protein
MRKITQWKKNGNVYEIHSTMNIFAPNVTQVWRMLLKFCDGENTSDVYIECIFGIPKSIHLLPTLNLFNGLDSWNHRPSGGWNNFYNHTQRWLGWTENTCTFYRLQLPSKRYTKVSILQCRWKSTHDNGHIFPCDVQRLVSNFQKCHGRHY